LIALPAGGKTKKMTKKKTKTSVAISEGLTESASQPY